jgi:hypothetical protein
MVDNDYWDAEEFNFFSELNDTDKLMYIYEIMLSKYSFRFIDDEYDEDTDEDADEDEVNFDEFKTNNTNTVIRLTGQSLESVNSIKDLMILNGLIVSESKIEYTDDGYVILSVTMLGKSNPICVN